MGMGVQKYGRTSWGNIVVNYDITPVEIESGGLKGLVVLTELEINMCNKDQDQTRDFWTAGYIQFHQMNVNFISLGAGLHFSYALLVLPKEVD